MTQTMATNPDFTNVVKFPLVVGEVDPDEGKPDLYNGLADSWAMPSARAATSSGLSRFAASCQHRIAIAFPHSQAAPEASGVVGASPSPDTGARKVRRIIAENALPLALGFMAGLIFVLVSAETALWWVQ